MSILLCCILLMLQDPTKASSEPATGMTLSVNQKTPAYSFHFVWSKDPEYSTVEEIEVFQGGSQQPIQKLDECMMDGRPQHPEDAATWFKAEDLDFDGYLDIVLEASAGATGNISNCIWLFDPETGRFVYSREFSELIGNHKTDPARKTITTRSNGSAYMYHLETYTVQDKKLVWIAEEKQEETSGKCAFHWTRSELRDGKMQVAEEKWLDKDGEESCTL